MLLFADDVIRLADVLTERSDVLLQEESGCKLTSVKLKYCRYKLAGVCSVVYTSWCDGHTLGRDRRCV